MSRSMSTSMREHTSRTLGYISSILLACLPGYIRQAFEDKPGKPFRNSSTSYLNGFRGFVAFLVFVRHFSLPWQPDLDYGFGQGDNHSAVFRLPILRMLYAGPNVPIFLVVSGYVMSLKPLNLLQIGDKEAFLKSMVSSVFRRAVRIFPPPILSSFLFMLAVHFQLYEAQYHTMHNFTPHYPERLPSFYEQLVDWLKFVFGDLTNPWSWQSPRSIYGPHLWTIGLQFRASMVLFLVLIGLSQSRKSVRQRVLVVMFLCSMFSGRWDVALYLSGMFTVGTQMETLENSVHCAGPYSSAAGDCHKLRQLPEVWRRIRWLAIVLLGLYLGSYPRARDGVGAPGYQFLYNISPSYKYWQGTGAIFLIWGMMGSKAAQKPFNCSLARYLGDISFSLYIVHEPLLHVFGYRMVNMAWSLTGKQTNFQYQLGFLLSLAITTPLVLWAAEIFQRTVDEPCAKLGRWLEMKCK